MDSLKQAVESRTFQSVTLGVIIFNAVITGWQTYEEGRWLDILQEACIWYFCIEIVLKLIALRSAFFKSGWNWFDLILIVVTCNPLVSFDATVLRIFRVFRVLRLIGAFKEVRIITQVLLLSIKSLIWISMLGLICTYVYAILGVQLFGQYQKEYATIHEACFSLFRSMTGEDWTDLRYDGMPAYGYLVPTIYHVTWMVVSTFLLVNLVIGAMLTHYQSVMDDE